MINIKSILTIFSLFAVNAVYAADLTSIIEKSDIGRNATIAISVKDTKNNKTVYEYNSHKLLNPASVQKIFTMKSAYSKLGENFIFQTKTFKDSEDNLYIKLSADPTFTTGSLKSLLTATKEHGITKVNDVIIDPSIVDNKEWGIGWMWDDDTSFLLPKYSAFTINENNIDINILTDKKNWKPLIKNNSNYDMQIVNILNKGEKNKINIDRTPWKSNDTTYISGVIKSGANIKLPVNSTERHFTKILEKSIQETGIQVQGIVKIAPIPTNAQSIATISSQPIEKILGTTLKNSNNLYSELIFKRASTQNSQGSTEKAVEMFHKYYADIKSDKPIIVDACGISRNNLISADWITSALNKIYKEKDFAKFNILLAKPMEGTLADRLLNISLKLRAKTGTASNISTIAGYIDTQNNKKYSFAIMIQNHNKPVIEVKKFEDLIINEIYKIN